MRIIFRFTNQQGVGDQIRGLISLLQMKKNLNFDLEINIYYHAINKYLLEESTDKYINEKCFYFFDEVYRNNKIFSQLIKDIYHNFDNLHLSTNSVPNIQNIDDDTKNFIKNLFILKPEYENYIAEKNKIFGLNYYLFHFRFDDKYFNDNDNDEDYDGKNEEYNKCLEFIKQYDDTKYNVAIISSSYEFKKIIQKNCVHIKLSMEKPIHTKNLNGDFLDTLCDFFMIKNAKELYTFSTYPWVSNFVLWSGILYDKNIKNLKL